MALRTFELDYFKLAWRTARQANNGSPATCLPKAIDLRTWAEELTFKKLLLRETRQQVYGVGARSPSTTIDLSVTFSYFSSERANDASIRNSATKRSRN